MPLQNDPTDATWTVMGCCVIFMMQLGFAMLETGCIGHQSNHQSATLLKVRHFATIRSMPDSVCLSDILIFWLGRMLCVVVRHAA